jgi:acyl-CoA thioesterase FadM
VLRSEDILVEGEVHLVCVDVQTFKPVSVPEILRKQWN